MVHSLFTPGLNLQLKMLHDTKNKNSWVVILLSSESGLILKNRDDAHREELLITTVTSFLLLSLMAFVSFMNARLDDNLISFDLILKNRMI